MLRLIYTLDGTVGMLGTIVNKACSLTDDDFKLFSEIQSNVLNDSEETIDDL
jgi:hypothetical protein